MTAVASAVPLKSPDLSGHKGRHHLGRYLRHKRVPLDVMCIRPVPCIESRAVEPKSRLKWMSKLVALFKCRSGKHPFSWCLKRLSNVVE